MPLRIATLPSTASAAAGGRRIRIDGSELLLEEAHSIAAASFTTG